MRSTELPQISRMKGQTERRTPAARETGKSRATLCGRPAEYIPDVYDLAKHGYRMERRLREDVCFGAELTLNLFAWETERRNRQRVAQQSQTEENLARIDKRIGIEIDKAYRKLERSKQMVDVAREALSLSEENARLSENGIKAGTVTTANHAEAVAALKRVEMGELQASLEYRLAGAELDRIRGVLASRR